MSHPLLLSSVHWCPHTLIPELISNIYVPVILATVTAMTESRQVGDIPRMFWMPRLRHNMFHREMAIKNLTAMCVTTLSLAMLEDIHPLILG